MKLAALLALPFALALLPHAEHTTVEDSTPAPERRRPIGFQTPYWTWQSPDHARHAKRGLPELPTEVAERFESFAAEMYEPQWIGRTYTPTGLELWIHAQDSRHAIGPALWHCFLRDPRTGALTPRSILLNDTMLDGDKPRVRFIDLDDDGRDELAFRQFEHNGTMVNNAVELYFSIEADLTLDLCLVQRCEISDLYSEGESGSVRSQLMLTDSGKLEADVWRENPESSVPRVPIGRLQLERKANGTFAIVSRTSLLTADANDQRYDFVLDYTFEESIPSACDHELLLNSGGR